MGPDGQASNEAHTDVSIHCSPLQNAHLSQTGASPCVCALGPMGL